MSASYIIYNFEVCVCIQLSYNPFPGFNQSQNVNKTLVSEVIRLKGTETLTHIEAIVTIHKASRETLCPIF